jgi:hypothetical protein
VRIRTDSWWEAGRKRAVLLGAVPDPLADAETDWDPDWLEFMRSGDEAKPGDVWVVRSTGHGRTYRADQGDAGPIVGYGLVCPAEHCSSGVHIWDHASDCPGRYQGGVCKNGGPGCWTWTGRPEDDTLTGNPSLLIRAEGGGCGWHGYLRDGQMVPV